MRTILTAPVRMVDAALGRPAQGDGHFQRPDREVALHPVADHCPAVDTQYR